MLETLEQANLFIVPLDDGRKWYRYHHLFADVLRSRSTRTAETRHAIPGREVRRGVEPLADAASLHRRASAWYEQDGLVAEAVSHAPTAGHHDRAARLVEQNAMPMLNRGELITLLNWMKAVDALIHQRPWLCVYRAWALTLTGQPDPAGPLLDEAERHVPADARAADGQDMLGHIAAFRAYVAGMHGDAQRCIELAQRALEYVPEGNLAV